MADPASPRAPGRPDDTLDDAGAGPAFEELIAEVSARFITLPPGEVEAEITRTLAKIGVFIKSDRCFIFLPIGDGTRHRVAQMWTQETVPQDPVAIGLVVQEEFYWVGAKMSRREDVIINALSDSLVVPGPEVVQLAAQKEFGDAGHLVALNNRAEVTSDNINYFPADARQGCRLDFFTAPMAGAPRIARDQVELSYNRACGGRLFFKIPGGVKLGTYNLDVKFKNSTVRVPFKIMTKDEVKTLEDQLKEMRKKK